MAGAEAEAFAGEGAGAGIHENGGGMKEIVLGESTTVAELADLLEVSATAVVKAALTELGLLATIDQRLSFREAGTIAVEFGVVARRRDGPGTDGT